MERFKVGLPDEDSIAIRDTFIVNEIVPVSIKKVNNSQFNILFLANNTAEEKNIYLQMAIAAVTKEDLNFLNNHQLNIDNVKSNSTRLNMYIEMVKDLTPENLYVTDFDMVVDPEHKAYYSCKAARSYGDDSAELLDLDINRDTFIKLSLFFIRITNLDITAETVFMNHKLHNIEFVKILHIKLDGSATDFASRIVCNHYTASVGPTIFKFNFISPKIKGRTLRNPMSPVSYNEFYNDDFVITDMIYDHHEDCLFILYEERSSVTDKYKCTKALRLDKEIYEHTNFLELDKIYE